METQPHRPRMVIPGGSGYLGRFVIDHFARRGWEVVVLRRGSGEVPGAARTLAWDGRSLGEWAEALEGAAAVLNMAGRSVNCRYDDRNRQEIYASRLDSTRVLGEAIGRCETPPRVWINASSATIYRHAQDRPMDETTGEIGSGFSVDVCCKWEGTLWEAVTPRTRKVAFRTALVLGKGPGGVLEPFVGLVRLGLGGAMAGGAQFVSWVHSEDLVRSIEWVIGHDALEGPVNCASPHPVSNRDFMRLLRRQCGRSWGLPSTRWMLEFGAMLMGTETELILKSRRVVPGRLLESGYEFRYSDLDAALSDLLRSHP